MAGEIIVGIYTELVRGNTNNSVKLKKILQYFVDIMKEP